MTKVSTLFDKQREDKKLKPIELLYCLIDSGSTPSLIRESWALVTDNIKLIARGKEWDTIACWNDGDDIKDVQIFLGHWNDGVVK